MTVNETPTTGWLTVPEVAEILEEPVTRVHRLLEDSSLLGSRRDGVLRIPGVFLVDARPLSSLRGTVIALHDVGLTDDEAIDWLLNYDQTLDATPIDALRAGNKAAVRRVARILA